ncbi:MAG: flagellar biosynthetic protein FliR, partial [Proteobacteria bacterium]|nr:flagellar biosynthetic protein FliR [Pseudomonadota bacterium]
PGRPVFHAVVMNQVLAAVGDMFVIAVKIGAPALAVLFFTKVAMGIVAKTVPQMNVLFVGMPLYIVIGLAVFALSLNFFVPILGRAISGLDGSLMTVLRIM